MAEIGRNFEGPYFCVFPKDVRDLKAELDLLRAVATAAREWVRICYEGPWDDAQRGQVWETLQNALAAYDAWKGE